MTNAPDLTAPEAVERWDIHPYDQYSIEQRRCDTGDWVQYSDYAVLSAERDALKAELADAVELVNLLYMRYDRALPSVEDLLARHQKETDT